MLFTDLLKVQATKPVAIIDQSKTKAVEIQQAEQVKQTRKAMINKKLQQEARTSGTDVARDTVIEKLPSTVTTKTVPKKMRAKDRRVLTSELEGDLPKWYPSVLSIDGRSIAAGLCPSSIPESTYLEMQHNLNALLSNLGFRHIVVSKQGEGL